MWQGGGVLFLIAQMSQNAIDDLLVLDARDHFGRASTASTGLDAYYCSPNSPMRAVYHENITIWSDPFMQHIADIEKTKCQSV